jgi:rhamnosyltransferase
VISLRRVAAPTASVVVRSFNSAATIARALDDLRGQTVELELIVVDSGSQDDTLRIAGPVADRVLQIPQDSYMPGRALNVGTRAASGEVVFAFSSHCRLPGHDWAERALAHYGDPEVAGVAGSTTTPDERPLEEPYVQRLEDVSLHPFWGFSNHASSWRRSVWEELPFTETRLVEDKEWALRVLESGRKLVFDPALWVDQSHRWRVGTLEFFRRERRETGALAQLIPMPPYGPLDLAREWLTPPDDEHSRLFHLLNYRRAAGLLGKYAGRRAARR